MRIALILAVILCIGSARAEEITTTSATGGSSGGTVTSVSVVNANGVSATVANPTTTPALTFTLGAITPTTVAIGGATIGSNALAVTGTSLFTGNVTVSGIIGGGGASGRFGSTGGNNGISLNDTNNGAQAGASAVYSWGGTTQISSMDTNFNRATAGVVNLGTTSANALGSLNLLSLTATGTITASGSGQINVAAMTQTSAAQSGTVCYNSGTGAITYDATLGCLTSTMEVKDDWRNITPQEALARVLKMQAGSFTYKKGRGLPDGEQIGLSAQQIETVDARLVGYRPNGELAGVRYQQASALYPMAIQALSSEIDHLKAHEEGQCNEWGKDHEGGR